MSMRNIQPPNRIADYKDLLEFRSILLKLRDLAEPDGRPLYRYRLKDKEFEALKGLLQRWTEDVQRRVRFEYAAAWPGFPGLFVLYCAEWWRRYYAGNGFKWEPIFESLNLTPDCLPVQDRSQCVIDGLNSWNLKLARHGGHAYIGNIALQGGLPVRLLAEERNGVGNLISKILRYAKNTSVTIQDLEMWAESLRLLLPKSYRDGHIFRLIAELTWTTLELAKTPGIRAAENPIEHLDQSRPGWRDSLPLALDDEQANQLIARILLEAVRTPIQARSQIFPVERKLTDDEGRWTLLSTAGFPESIRSDDFVRFFGINLDNEDTPRFGEVSISAGNLRLSATLRRMIGREEYRLSGRPDEIFGHDAACEHIVSLTLPDGRIWQAPAPKGIGLDEELPWLFAAEESGYRFIRQGGGSVASPSAAIAVATGWQVQTLDSNGTVEFIGSLDGFDRKIYRISGNIVATCAGVTYRIRTGNAADAEQIFEWQGKRLWIDAVNPSMVFCGKPLLYSVSENGAKTRINGELSLSAIGSGIPADCGPVVARYCVGREILLRTRMLLLPADASLRINPGDARSGTITFCNWEAASATAQGPGVTTTCSKVDKDLTLSIGIENGVATPENIEVSIYWPHSPHPALLRLPFPGRGVRCFDRHGREISVFRHIAVQDLAGTRLIVCGLTFKNEAHLVLKAEKKNVSRRYRIRNNGLTTEIRLADFRSDIERLHTIDDNPDSKVELTVEIGGNPVYRIFILPSQATLIRKDDSVSIDLLELDDPSAAESAAAHALALERPGEEPLELERIDEDNMITWRFDPNQFAPGSWLIYPPPEGSIQFRPTLMTVGEIVETDNCFVRAISVPDRVLRENTIDNLIAELTSDFDNPAWNEVNQTARQLGHLPLSRLDVWRRFARSPQAMAALAFRYNDFTGRFLTRFASELPFSWDTIAFCDWKAAAGKLRYQTDRLFGDSAPQIFSAFLQSRIKDLTAEFGTLAFLLGIIQANYFDDAARQAIALREAIGPSAADYLFAGESSLLMRLRRINFDEQWPRYDEIIDAAKDDRDTRRYMYYENLGFQNTVINLPLILAADVAFGKVHAWFDDPARLHALEQCRNFDPDWFDEAYNYTIARCYSDGLFD